MPKRGTTNAGDLEAALDIFKTAHPELQHHVTAHTRMSKDGGFILVFETRQREYWQKLQKLVPYGEYLGVPAGIEYRPSY